MGFLTAHDCTKHHPGISWPSFDDHGQDTSYFPVELSKHVFLIFQRRVSDVAAMRFYDGRLQKGEAALHPKVITIFDEDDDDKPG